MNEKKELIWVDAEFAKKYNALVSEANVRELQITEFEKYMETVKQKSRDDFKCCLESLEEDAAMYVGLMLKVKKTFEAACSASLNASYDLWEGYDKSKTATMKKVDSLVEMLKPLEAQTKTVNELLSKIDSWGFDRLVKTLETVSGLSEKSMKILQFCMNNYNIDK